MDLRYDADDVLKRIEERTNLRADLGKLMSTLKERQLHLIESAKDLEPHYDLLREARIAYTRLAVLNAIEVGDYFDLIGTLASLIEERRIAQQSRQEWAARLEADYAEALPQVEAVLQKYNALKARKAGHAKATDKQIFAEYDRSIAIVQAMMTENPEGEETKSRVVEMVKMISSITKN